MPDYVDLMTTEYLIGCFHLHDGSAVSQLTGEGGRVIWLSPDARTPTDRLHPLSENCARLDWSADAWWVIVRSDDVHDVNSDGPHWVSGELLCCRPWADVCAWLARTQLTVPRRTPSINTGGAMQPVHSDDGVAIASVGGIASTETGVALALIEGDASSSNAGVAVVSCGHARAGERGTAIASIGTASVGRGGVAFCRESGHARTACHGLAIAGDGCDAGVDGQGIAIAGYGGRASVRELGVAICTGRLRYREDPPAGVRAGLGGVLIMFWFDPLIRRCRPCVAIVDGERIKPDTLYTCIGGEFVEAL